MIATRSTDGARLRGGGAAVVRRARRHAVRVRAASPRDAAEVAALRLALVAEESPGARVSPGLEARARRLSAAHIGAEGDVTLLAIVSGRIAGMARCVEVSGAALARPSRYAVLTSAFVRPAFRRRGVLRALLGAADAWCRARRIGEIRLHCRLANDGGQAAWSALGFSPVEIRYRRAVPGR
jgi:GNAT superfamily N-acetyltransferase